ncbi:uncharacterized protein EDB93DRAFT_1292081 [Suillus bovinus]|uniref:uncharacterized protein n=1 Tax=Suillus bovinus TaxID=48563 RepID=UPI001B85BA56|nr:uncharacterized protein EDB93DRAFT_1292081 [Suillus bovinus]KAG2143468.1 hypothetical protein EDB93DRAFT_1292081 [Suillus bovinus]
MTVLLFTCQCALLAQPGGAETHLNGFHKVVKDNLGAAKIAYYLTYKNTTQRLNLTSFQFKSNQPFVIPEQDCDLQLPPQRLWIMNLILPWTFSKTNFMLTKAAQNHKNSAESSSRLQSHFCLIPVPEPFRMEITLRSLASIQFEVITPRISIQVENRTVIRAYKRGSLITSAPPNTGLMIGPLVYFDTIRSYPGREDLASRQRFWNERAATLDKWT